MPHRNLTGLSFGRLTILQRATNAGQGHKARTRWLCLCACGTEKIVYATNLLRGLTLSCGCYRAKKIAEALTKHANCTGNPTPEYKSWQHAKERCFNPANPAYKDYGGRGITMCDEWKNDFGKFLQDMGRRPQGRTSLDRYPNPNGNYEPGNCRWATPKQQNRNQRTNVVITVDGESRCIAEWSELTGIKAGTIQYRISHGWSHRQSLNK